MKVGLFSFGRAGTLSKFVLIVSGISSVLERSCIDQFIVPTALKTTSTSPLIEFTDTRSV